MKIFTGDIRNMQDVTRAFHGATDVIHCCGFISIGTFPDKAKMHSINVEGDVNVL